MIKNKINPIVILLSIFLLTQSCATRKTETANWENTKNIKNPESAFYDSARNRIFVSNMDGSNIKKDKKGHISILSEDGKTISSKWVSNLNAPKGMRVKGNYLFVTDIDEVLKIDITDATIVKKYKIKGAKFLNDIDIDKVGNLYVSDTVKSQIWIIKNGKAKKWLSGKKVPHPNGLLIKDDLMYVASWGKGMKKDWSVKEIGKLYSVNLKSKLVAEITKEGLGRLDGIEFDNEGNFIVSDWWTGTVWQVNGSGASTLLFQGPKGLADIGFNPNTNQIIAPLMNSDKVIGVDL